MTQEAARKENFQLTVETTDNIKVIRYRVGSDTNDAIAAIRPIVAAVDDVQGIVLHREQTDFHPVQLSAGSFVLQGMALTPKFKAAWVSKDASDPAINYLTSMINASGAFRAECFEQEEAAIDWIKS